MVGTRASRSDSVSARAMRDLARVDAQDIGRNELRQIAARCSVSLRPQADVEAWKTQLRRVLAPAADAAPAAPRQMGVPSPPMPVSPTSPALPCADASQTVAPAPQQPAAVQRPPQEASSSQSSAPAGASGPQVVGPAWRPTASEHIGVLHRCKAAEDMAARRQAELVSLRAECDVLRVERDALRAERDSLLTHSASQAAAVADLASAVESAAEPVHIILQVHEAAMPSTTIPHAEVTSAVSVSSPPQQHLPPPGVPSQLRAQPASTPAAALPRNARQRQQQPRQQQRTQMAPPSSREWVFAGLDFPADSTHEQAAAAVAGFAVQQLQMADAAQQLQVVRVSARRDGLAVVRLRSPATERTLRTAKAKLPDGCTVSIFRSVPPEQRGAAAFLRQAQRQQPLLAAEEVAAARSAARAALAFARRRVAAARQDPGPLASCPPPAVAPLGACLYTSIIPNEHVLHASADDTEPSQGVAAAAVPSSPNTPSTAASVTAC